MINGINGSTQSMSYSQQASYSSTNVTMETEAGSVSVSSETLEVSESYSFASTDYSALASGTYKPDMQKIQDMKLDLSKNMSSLTDLISKMLNKQAKTSNSAMDNLNSILGEVNQAGGVEALAQKKAQELISEDGYWGVNKTSERILDFAKALSGGDPEKIDLLRDAFQKGYDEAEKIWGGKLPEISQQTHEKVMQGFDDWAAQAGIAPASGAATE